MIVFAGIVPHPPLAVPGVGKDDVKKVGETVKALEKLSEKLAEAEPDTIIVISPHMVHYPHLFNICGMGDLFGGFSAFGFAEFEWHGRNNVGLATEIADKSEEEGIPAILYNNGEEEYEIDHSVMVPLYYIMQKIEHSFKVLPIGYSVASRGEHYSFGQIIAAVCERHKDQRIAIIASGDLSHRLLENPGSQNTGKAFDKEIVELVKKGDEFSIVNIDEDILDHSGECGYRSILILLGVLSGRDYAPEVYSYEGPFGVGYMVANMGVRSS